MFIYFCAKTEDSLLMSRTCRVFTKGVIFAETHVLGGNKTDIKHSVNVNSVKMLKESGHLEYPGLYGRIILKWIYKIRIGRRELAGRCGHINKS
jgi:hypothetical protein